MMPFKFLVISAIVTVLLFSEAVTSVTWMRLNSSPVCFGARGNQFGRFSFNRNIFVRCFLIVHRSGAVSCNGVHYSYWGCTPNDPNLSTVLTDQQNKLLAPTAVHHNGWYTLAGYTSSSSILRFCVSGRPHCYFANSELRLWYGEDLKGYTEGDNAGRSCADVYGLLA